MKKILTLSLLLLIFACNTSEEKKDIDFTTVFETSNGLETATYNQTIAYYSDLASAYPEIQIQAIGSTDSGQPLHLVILNPDTEFNFKTIRKNKRILLINNGIHAGESDGIDATMMLYRDIVQGKIEAPKNTVLATIPIYNIGGSLNRNSTSRTNQNGPVAYGFRGNAKNYDLNRDFIKADTKNAQTFAKIFHLVQPDVFIDNHVSNGADYQYALTHLFTQHNKLGGELGEFLNTTIHPELERKLEAKHWSITPYVNVFNTTPETGFSQFMDYPRYSTGYTTLFNTLGMMVETHMLKPYKQRVEGTYELMRSMIEITDEQSDAIAKLRKESWKIAAQKSNYPVDWKIDTTKSTTFNFKGFEGRYISSDITGQQRLKFYRDEPFTKPVKYQNYFVSSKNISVPSAYIIPQGWHNVIDRLALNQVTMTPFASDTIITVESYKIDKFNTRNAPYEGHYQHSNTTVITSQKEIIFKAGDYLVNTHQPAFRYLMETLEPSAPDSFFNWNFFDTILQQKEGFSPYVWEDKAKELLAKHSALKKEFDQKKQNDTAFANNWYAQLDWLHKHSDNYEKAHLQYPIYRVK